MTAPRMLAAACCLIAGLTAAAAQEPAREPSKAPETSTAAPSAPPGGEITGPRRLVDVVRALHGDRPGPLTWWSWAGESFVKDVGWRIDHQLASPAPGVRGFMVALIVAEIGAFAVLLAGFVAAW